MDNAPYDIVHLMEPVFIKLAGAMMSVFFHSVWRRSLKEKIFKGNGAVCTALFPGLPRPNAAPHKRKNTSSFPGFTFRKAR